MGFIYLLIKCVSFLVDYVPSDILIDEEVIYGIGAQLNNGSVIQGLFLVL